MLSSIPRDVLDEIWDLIESVSEGFLPTLIQKLATNCHTIFSKSSIEKTRKKLPFLDILIIKMTGN